MPETFELTHEQLDEFEHRVWRSAADPVEGDRQRHAGSVAGPAAPAKGLVGEGRSFR